MHSLIAPTINLLALVGVLAYYLRQPLKEFVSQRHSFLRDEIQSVREQLRKAQGSYDEFTAKLKAIEVEAGALLDQARQDAAATRARIVDNAQKLSANIAIEAKSSAQNAFGDLRAQLRSELATQVVGRAEELLRERLTGDDKARIRREFSVQVESIQ